MPIWREVHYGVVDGWVSASVAHDLSDVVDPDLVGEVQREEPVGPARRVGEIAGQQRGAVGGEDRLLGRERPHLRVELPLDVQALGRRLDHELRLANRVCETRRIPDPGQGGPGGAVGRPRDLLLVPGPEPREPLPGRLEDFVADVEDDDLEAGVRGLVRDLRTEDAGSEHGDVVDAGHMVVLLSLDDAVSSQLDVALPLPYLGRVRLEALGEADDEAAELHQRLVARRIVEE